jgi:hypothetical protein
MAVYLVLPITRFRRLLRPFPQAWFSHLHFSFIIFHFSFPRLPFRLLIFHFSSLTALCSRKAVPPFGSRYRVIFRAAPQRLGSSFSFHLSAFSFHLSAFSFQVSSLPPSRPPKKTN